MSYAEWIDAGEKFTEAYQTFCLPVCKKYHLKQSALDIILFLANHPLHNTARDISRILGIKSGTVSVTLENLIQIGYLVRENDVQDRRIQRLKLTAQAAPLVQKGQQQQLFREAIAKNLTPEDLQTFARITRQLIENAEQLNHPNGSF